jgi:hypothetical protein
MACNYEAIRRDNERRYGIDIGRIGPMLLADRYDDRTHFIYELLQNAEDALAERGSWSGKRAIRFELVTNALRVSHFGKPFDEADVRAICGIAERPKGLTAIGRFGIGFKSVYAFTDRPEVYSGNESFAIESFVWPVGIKDIERQPEETVIVLPLRDPAERTLIEAGLKHLGPTALLFLRSIEEIEWSVDDGASGLYLRSQPEMLAQSVRRVTVIGRTEGSPDVEESWLIFSRSVSAEHKDTIGHVEIAFSVERKPKAERETLRRIPRSPLVVFFPTALETHLGFLVQGPYRTTPSRDNVPAQDEWNRRCVAETAAVLRDALLWLRDHGWLDAGALHCLPLDRTKFAERVLFTPIFEAARGALAEKALLPSHGGGYISAKQARLARTQELRELLTAQQLTALFGAEAELAWVTGDISQDRTPELREYLVKELKIEEIRPETLFARLTKTFLEAQPDEWVRRLYEFLADQRALLWRARELPLVRLEDGRHVRPQENGRPQAFLPGQVPTDFPTVRATVCDSDKSRDFLQALGLTEADLVDDVIVNVLPRYSTGDVIHDAGTYEADIDRILRAYRTDSATRRRKLVDALRAKRFVAVREQSSNAPQMATPDDVYVATERLAKLFAGVKGVVIVDDGYPCLKGEDVRELLEACGAARYLRPIQRYNTLSWDQMRELRERAGHPSTSSRNDRVEDWTLFGLDALLKALPGLAADDAAKRARLLWEELGHLEERRGKSVFMGEYTWTHYGNYRQPFDAAFVRTLNSVAWIPGPSGALQRPDAVRFDTLGWKSNPFLQEKIRFKPPILEQLAQEAGIEPGVIDLLKKRGITREAQLRELLGPDDERPAGTHELADVNDALEKLGITAKPTAPVADPSLADAAPQSGGGGSANAAKGAGGEHEPASSASPSRRGESRGTAALPPSSAPPRGGAPGFISYVAVHPDDEEIDPDGLDQPARMALEEKAIEFIIKREPDWQRAATTNPGFDLFKASPDGERVQWCEVKAMTRTLKDRPVGLSREQFHCAQEHGSVYWLYVVECANTEQAGIVRIQDPAGKARTFTFDHGWLDVAEVDDQPERREN